MKTFVKNSVNIILLFILISCGRGNPDEVNSSEVTNLSPIATYNLTITEPSGICYNHKNNSLMIVSDGNANIFETDLQGNVIRTIPSVSTDMEGIALSKNCDTIYITEERNKLVVLYNTNGVKLHSFSIDVASSDNNALEGITLDKVNNFLYIVNEKNPCLILKYKGDTEIWRKDISCVSDISDIYYENNSGCLWIISDESKKIVKLSETGDFVSEWNISFDKGEGITIVNSKIYIVNDSNSKLYVFNKPD